jgi:hypothetical protein
VDFKERIEDLTNASNLLLNIILNRNSKFFMDDVLTENYKKIILELQTIRQQLKIQIKKGK